MTKIQFLDFLMDKVTQMYNSLLDLYDYLKEQKFLALLDEVDRLRTEIDILKEAERACKKQQDTLNDKIDFIKKELANYKGNENENG